VLGPRLAATGWFNHEYLQHLVDAHQSGVRDYSAPLWTLLMFEAFLRKVLDESQFFPANKHGSHCAVL
jgi:asparagine synthase (glutamine-hydrolysing)